MVEYISKIDAQSMINDALERAAAQFQPTLPVKSKDDMPPARKGAVVFVPDATAGPAIAVGDGTNWKEYQSTGNLS